MLATEIIFITLCFSFYTGSHGMFTPLEIDNHPCQPENLKVNIKFSQLFLLSFYIGKLLQIQF